MSRRVQTNRIEQFKWLNGIYVRFLAISWEDEWCGAAGSSRQPLHDDLEDFAYDLIERCIDSLGTT
jgi:hypothetical protein